MTAEPSPAPDRFAGAGKVINASVGLSPAAKVESDLHRLLDHAGYLLGAFDRATHTDQLSGSDLRAAERAAADIRAALAASPPEIEQDAVERAVAWLRQCSGWMLTNDLDMVCPMTADPLDIADQLALIAQKGDANGLSD